jgi:hypothetical protein
MKKLIPILILTVLHLKSAPPDKPLTGQEWAAKMGNGSWLLFRYPPETLKGVDKMTEYNDKLPAQLKKAGIGGGRLHVSIGGRYTEGQAIYDADTMKYTKESLEYLEKIIDAFMEQDMSLMLQINAFHNKDHKTEKGHLIGLKRNYSLWEQLCKAFKDKSHNLAMAPMIEAHHFDWMGKKNMDKQWDAYHKFLDKCTVIFRKYNPTRLMGYKPYLSAKGPSFMSTKDPYPGPLGELKFPYGNDPHFKSGKPFYYIAIFAAPFPGPWFDWGTFKHYTKEEIIELTYKNQLKPVAKFQKETGIQTFEDHWYIRGHKQRNNRKDMEMAEKYPDKHTRQIETIEQSLERMEYVYRFYKKYKIPSAGPFLSLIYHNDNEDFKDSKITKKMRYLYDKYRWSK